MADLALKNSGAGYNLASPMYPNRLTVKTNSPSLHTVTFQTDYKDTQIQFHFDESFPSRIPKFVVSSGTLTGVQKSDLCELLQRKGKAEEYSNTLLLPMLLEHAVQWIKDNYGKKPAAGTTSKVTGGMAEIREESWQLNSVSISEPTRTTQDTQKQKKGCHDQMSNNLTSPGDQVNWPASTDTSWSTATGSDSFGLTSDWCSPSEDWSVIQKKTKPKPQRGPEKKLQFTIDTVPHIQVKRDTRRANYFVAVRCTNRELGDVVEDTVKKMLEVDLVYKPISYTRDEVHVTLTTVALHTEDEVKAAVKALEDAKMVLIDHAPTSSLTISGIDNFQGNKVVYGKVKVMEDVLLFRKVVRWAFQKAGISPRDNFDYTPHMTLAKVNVLFIRKTELETISKNIYEPLQNTYFGKQSVDGIHLCKMGHERRADGFYICPTEIVLKK